MGEEIVDPVTLTTAAVVGSAAIGAGSSVMGGVQSYQAGAAQAEAYQQQAAAERQKAGAQVAAQDFRAGKEISAASAGAAASGITQESAQPVLLEDYASQKVSDMYTRYNGDLAATQDVYSGQLAKYEGQQGLISGIFGGVQNVLGGVGAVGRLKMGGGWGNLRIGSGVTP